MAKLLSSLIEDISEIEEADESFSLNVIAVNINDSDEIESMAWVKPVHKIGVDTDSKEFLFHFEENPEDGSHSANLSDLFGVLEEPHLDFEVCAALEHQIDDDWVRIDHPIIGIGQNIENKEILVVTKA